MPGLIQNLPNSKRCTEVFGQTVLFNNSIRYGYITQQSNEACPAYDEYSVYMHIHLILKKPDNLLTNQHAVSQFMCWSTHTLNESLPV